MGKFVQFNRGFNNMEEVESLVRTVAMKIKTSKPIDNFRIEAIRLLIRAYSGYLYLEEKKGKEIAYGGFPTLVMKRMDILFKKYAYKGSPTYFQLFDSEKLDQIKDFMYKFFRALDEKTVISLKSDIEKKKVLIDNLIKGLDNQNLIKK